VHPITHSGIPKYGIHFAKAAASTSPSRTPNFRMVSTETYRYGDAL